MCGVVLGLGHVRTVTRGSRGASTAAAAGGAAAAAEPEVARQPAAAAAASGGRSRLPAAEELVQPPPASSETISLEQPSEQRLGHCEHVLGCDARQRSPQKWKHGHSRDYESDISTEETVLW